MIYERIEGKTGVKYRADKKFISKDKIPVLVLEKLGHDSPIKYNPCIFCGQEGKRGRLVNGVMIYLCDSDYYSKSYGAVVAQERKLNGIQQEASR